MCAVSEKISAKEAKEIGLVNIVVSNSEVLNIALERYAKKFAQAPTLALGMIKKLLNTSFETTLDSALENEALMQDIAGNSADYKEGVNSFLEKRKPKFTGK
jgi:2-(1,2-epoxy-1,2-dihydrophenyl)acetyl-CoA isomerase